MELVSPSLWMSVWVEYFRRRHSGLTTPGSSESATTSEGTPREEERPPAAVCRNESIVRSIAARVPVEVVQLVFRAVVRAIVVRSVRRNGLLDQAVSVEEVVDSVGREIQVPHARRGNRASVHGRRRRGGRRVRGRLRSLQRAVYGCFGRIRDVEGLRGPVVDGDARVGIAWQHNGDVGRVEGELGCAAATGAPGGCVGDVQPPAVELELLKVPLELVGPELLSVGVFGEVWPDTEARPLSAVVVFVTILDIEVKSCAPVERRE